MFYLHYINQYLKPFQLRQMKSIILPYFCSLFLSILLKINTTLDININYFINFRYAIFIYLCINELKLYPDKLITISISLDSFNIIKISNINHFEDGLTTLYLSFNNGIIFHLNHHPPNNPIVFFSMLNLYLKISNFFDPHKVQFILINNSIILKFDMYVHYKVKLASL
jgi:hypothetical protein